MLTALQLRHFALIEKSIISFEKGFNVLTGETGAGKTMIIQAIHLLMGQKADPSMIRRGEEKAIIEASFDIENLPLIHHLLDQAGIPYSDNILIIKREISRNAKNRIFINAELASLQLLASLGSQLFEIASQNTSISLQSTDQQLQILDLYGKINKASYRTTYEKEKRLLQQLTEMKKEKQIAHHLIEQIRLELQDLEAIDLSEDEQTLFETYKKHLDNKELTEAFHYIIEGLDQTIFPTLSAFKKRLPQNELLETIFANVNELSFSLSSKLDELNLNLQEIENLEQKLSRINKIKKTYHLQLSEIPKRITDLQNKLEHLETLDLQIEQLQKQLKETQTKREALASKLTKDRLKTALNLEKAITKQLHLLNMADAQFCVKLTPKQLGDQGADSISFLLAANLGEKLTPLKNKISGGELSRLLFSFKLILADKEAVPILIFDEIDANIGGETATSIGEKLRELSQLRQILCITHFSQVARFATHHLLIAKQKIGSRTITNIQPLNKEQRQLELLRMLGGKNTLTPH